MAQVGNAFENSCILVAVGVVAILLNMSFIVQYGYRRIFILTGLIICGICQLVMAVVYTAHPGTIQTGKATVGLSIIYIISYNVRILPTECVRTITDCDREESLHWLGWPAVNYLPNVYDHTPSVWQLPLDFSAQ